MVPTEREVYVDAALALHKIHVAPARRAALTTEFDRVADMAKQVLAVRLPNDAAPAPQYRP